MRRRILQSTVLVVAITSMVLGIPLALLTWNFVEGNLHSDLSRRLKNIVEVLDEQRGRASLEAVQIAIPANGQLTVRTPYLGTTTIGTDPGPGAVVETLPMGDQGSVTLAVPGDEMRQTQVQVTGLVLVLMVLSIAAGAAVATLTARRLAEPLRDVADRAARLGAGDFRPVAQRYGISELDRVAEVLDTSAAALSRLVQRERDLVGDVSHQLRSRLTALQLRLDELATNQDEDTAAEAEAALEQAERLGEVLDELLQATEAARAGTAEPVDLSELLREVAGEWREPAAAQRRSLRMRIDDGLLARVTPGRIREAVGVLVDNALQHGSGPVTLAARPGGPERDTAPAAPGRDAALVIEVSDAGAGIPDALIPHVFERGVSGAASTGVGLALARALVEADSGRLELSSARPATFTVYLRAARADDVAESPRPASSAVR